MAKQESNFGKKLSIAEAQAMLNKKYGEGTLVRLGDTNVEPLTRYSTGSLSLDQALGGGIPGGRVIEVYGPPAGGKTALATRVGISVQQAGRKFGILDVEHAFDPLYAQKLGLDIDELFYAAPNTGEEAFEIAEMLALTGEFGAILFDSIASAQPGALNEKDMGDAHMGTQAKMFSDCLRRLVPTLDKTDTALIFINQLREKVGVMYGNPEVTPGGKAVGFYSSVRLDVRPIEYFDENGKPQAKKDGAAGQRTRVKSVKNKTYRPYLEAEYLFFYEYGIDEIADLMQVGIVYKVIEKGGSWFSYTDTAGKLHKAQGEPAFRDVVVKEDLFTELKGKVNAAIAAKLKAEQDSKK